MPKDISLFIDGELNQDSIETTLKKLKDDDELQYKWFTYHMIGDTLRQNSQISPGFCDRFTKLLSQEPTVFIPRSRFNKMQVISMSVAASLAAILMVTGVILHSFDYRAENIATLWSKPVENKLVSKTNNQAVREYLIAHQEFSPSTMIQGVAPYARTVSNVSQDTAP